MQLEHLQKLLTKEKVVNFVSVAALTDNLTVAEVEASCVEEALKRLLKLVSVLVGDRTRLEPWQTVRLVEVFEAHGDRRAVIQLGHSLTLLIFCKSIGSWIACQDGLLSCGALRKLGQHLNIPLRHKPNMAIDLQLISLILVMLLQPMPGIICILGLGMRNIFN